MSTTNQQPARFRVGIATDDAAVALRDHLAEVLRDDERVVEVIDFGVRDADDHTPYPIPCIRAAEAIRDGAIDRAVVLGGTGLGEAISANKVRGVRAAVATDPFSLERSVLSNNCQVLALGERVVGFPLAARLVTDWLGYRFDPQSPSAAKVAVITEYEATGRLSSQN
ncbi:D-erythrulose-4-phosphate isomerase 1 [Microlunatus endophyticus]|uniref:D-erythrulose-4-phosphate isomerase 1 n=1 Tax=Microlunatus endophyticus TaxID=1716077 RepID=A0A917W7C6_9ACTN|nr:RpiB/LacA/LacB family sugar-phosphate isomerase [Microlunatus endophyticus]GGL73589.1 D-erythrulose-4-phosphate isomerase 1 [Microlunatus endophyticus]